MMACREGRGYGVAAEHLAQGAGLWVAGWVSYYNQKNVWEGAPGLLYSLPMRDGQKGIGCSRAASPKV